MSNTQLTTVSNYDVSRMIFSIPQESKIPNSSFSYKRININTVNDDNTVGELILKTPYLFSFGVQENRNPETKEVNGYVMPLCLWNRQGPSKEETEFINTFNAICERAKDYLVEHRNDIGKWDLEMADLKKFNPIFWKRDKTGKIEAGTGPTLYPKLINTKRNGVERIMTIFYDTQTNDEINPLDVLGKFCQVTSAIKIESVFIGTRISLQIKLWEAEVTLQTPGVKSLLRKTIEQRAPIENHNSFSPIKQSPRNDAGSLNHSDDEEYVAPPPVPATSASQAAPAKRSVRRK